MTEIISVDNLRVTYHRGKDFRPLIHGIDLAIPSGKITGLVGESGSGKSLTMKAIMNLLSERLEVSFDTFEFDGMSVAYDSKTRLPISMIFQDPMTSLNPLRTIGYHLVEVIQRYQKVSGQEAKKIALEELDKVGIQFPETCYSQYPHELSGGMRQRIMIAMALLTQSKVLIADEPTTALDVTVQAQILSLIKQRQISEGLTVVLVTHDFGVVSQMCDEVKVMLDGKIVEEGTRQMIFNQAKHPYTQELLKAIPSMQKAQRLYAMKPMRLSQKEKEHAKMVEIQPGHRVLEVLHD